MKNHIVAFAAAAASAWTAQAVSWNFVSGTGGALTLVSAVTAGETAVSVPSEQGGAAVSAISGEAFSGCAGLLEVTVPASVSDIHATAFWACPTLRKIIVEDGNPAYSDKDGILYNADGTCLLGCPEGRTGEVSIPAGTVDIDAAAFRNCGALESLVIPPSVETVGDGAFSGCSGLRAVLAPQTLSAVLPQGDFPAGCDVGFYAPGGFDDPTLPPRWAVSFRPNGGSGSMPAQYVECGVSAALSANRFVRTGHVFAGWSRTASGAVSLRDRQTVKDLVAASSTVVLHAKWTPIGYTVAFDANGGSGTMADESFVWGSAKKLRANAFAKKGYAFSGWSLEKGGPVVHADGQTVSNLTPESGGVVTLYAVWTGVVYKVAFNANDGSGRRAAQSMRYGKAKALRANAFVRKGHVFLGWAKKPGGAVVWKDGQTVSNLSSKAGKTVNLYAVWAVKTYFARFLPNGGTGSMARQKFAYGKRKALSKNAFVRKGFTFTGWARKAKGPKKYADGASVLNLTKTGATLSFYAKWRRNRYAVRFMANGGEGEMPDLALKWGVASTLPKCAFSRKTFTFAGWATSPSGKVKYANAASVSNLTAEDGGTVRLHAVWAKTVYRVSFDPNGGFGSMDVQKLSWGRAAKLSACAFARDGHKFAGWAKSASASSPVYKDGASVKNLVSDGSTVVLFAVWTKLNDPNVVVCLGDSITQGFRCAGQPYPSRLAHLAGKAVVNCGVGGTTSADGLKTADRNIAAANPGTVCIMFGANDAIHNVDSRVTKANLRAIVNICRNRGCRPILATPPHQSGSHERFNDNVKAIVSRIRELAREEGVTLVDVNAAFGGNDAHLNPNDGLHLSDSGGALIARLFAGAL